MRNALYFLIAGLLLTACTATAPRRQDPTVGSPGHPVMIVAYTPNEQVRVGFEDRMEADLQAAGISAVPSHNLVGNFSLVQYDWVMRAAQQRNAPMILMVRRLITDLPGDGTTAPDGISRHRSLRAYFLNADRTRLADTPPPGRQVIEVMGYRRGGDTTELVWSGYSWVDYDGDLADAIARTSDIISKNLAPACKGMSCDF